MKTAKYVFYCVFVVYITSCAAGSDPLKIQGKSVEEVYKEANASLSDKTYDKAIKLYNALEATYPYGTYAQQALLELAYAYYEYDQYEEALSTIVLFINTYPTNQNIDYALYLKGYINYHHSDGFFAQFFGQDISELDSDGLKEAYKAFTVLVSTYPKSKYVPDTKNRINEVVLAIAKGEMIKIRYYMGIKAYLAAINRANTVITTCSTTGYVEEALAVEIVAYEKLGDKNLANSVRKVLALNYPNSRYMSHKWEYKNFPWYKI